VGGTLVGGTLVEGTLVGGTLVEGTLVGGTLVEGGADCGNVWIGSTKKPQDENNTDKHKKSVKYL